MQKHMSFILMLFIIILLVTSCAKKSTYYYTNLMTKHLKQETNITGAVLDLDSYSHINLTAEDINVIKDFTENLKSKNFISIPNDLQKKPKYKIYLGFNKTKYVINVYSEKYLSIHPWDGKFTMDYIDSTDIYLSNNLYALCKNRINLK